MRWPIIGETPHIKYKIEKVKKELNFRALAVMHALEYNGEIITGKGHILVYGQKKTLAIGLNHFPALSCREDGGVSIRFNERKKNEKKRWYIVTVENTDPNEYLILN